MKIIFLDIDGVLNVIEQGYDKYGAIFHSNFIDNLRKIIKETDAKIIISSSWKGSGLQFLLDMWKDRNYPGEIIGITPFCSDLINLGLFQHHDEVCRGDEIQYFLDNTKLQISQYVIIDDDDDMLDSQLNNYVKTSNNSKHEDCIDIGYGLTKLCTKKVIEILNKI